VGLISKDISKAAPNTHRSKIPWHWWLHWVKIKIKISCLSGPENYTELSMSLVKTLSVKSISLQKKIIVNKFVLLGRSTIRQDHRVFPPIGSNAKLSVSYLWRHWGWGNNFFMKRKGCISVEKLKEAEQQVFHTYWQQRQVVWGFICPEAGIDFCLQWPGVWEAVFGIEWPGGASIDLCFSFPLLCGLRDWELGVC
jgi:hypothetical protein